MEKVYQTTVISTRGQASEVKATEGDFYYKIVSPYEPEPNSTNPEQLLAAGFGACFSSALSFALAKYEIEAETSVATTVSLYRLDEGELPNVVFGADLEVHIEGVDLELAQKLVEVAHAVCPYAKALKGEIEITVKVV